ncbi:hypothetical protein E0E52_19715 [Azotobacter chroococcum]|uniref:hypothetical protein n=1 Tax=Azotobacter chroococcum TaxID=353 RepID=UPI00103BF636|nr:hypothetical protein [Azotobacter chroococcum]TBW01368.1 hypothetical protein E0E52_19715 [Azotobacter chroococcum]
MEFYKYRRREASVVLIGTFFPLLLTPHWFVRNRLLPSEDVDQNIGIDVIVKEFARFSLSSITIEVQENRLSIKSFEESFDFLMLDLAKGILALLPESNVTAIGLNIYHDLECLDIDFAHFLGDMLVPKDIWSSAFPESPRFGLINLQVQAVSPGGDSFYNFSVFPVHKPDLVRFSLNNHFEKKADSSEVGSKGFEAVEVIESGWASTLSLYEHVSNYVLDAASEGFANERS